VGADRGLKRLSVWTLRDVELEPIGGVPGPTATVDTSLRDVLSLMLTEGTNHVDAVDENGAPLGRIRMETITRLVGPGGAPGVKDEVARV
jgi:CBS domain-containing protein